MVIITIITAITTANAIKITTTAAITIITTIAVRRQGPLALGHHHRQRVAALDLQYQLQHEQLSGNHNYRLQQKRGLEPFQEPEHDSKNAGRN